MFKQMILGLGLLLAIFGSQTGNKPVSAAQQVDETAAPTVEATPEPVETPATEPAVEITDEPARPPGQAPGTVEPLPESPGDPTAEPVTPEPTGEAAPPAPELTEEPVVEPNPPVEPTVEPNPPAEPTTAPPVESGGIISKILVEGRPAGRQNGHQLTALDSSGSHLTSLTAADGSLTLVDLPAGHYRLLAQSPGFLAAGCDLVIEDGILTSLSGATLRAGDLDSSGEVDLIDAVTIGAVFGSTQPGELADLNLDGAVDILDFVLLAANFGQSSAANPWLCQAQ